MFVHEGLYVVLGKWALAPQGHSSKVEGEQSRRMLLDRFVCINLSGVESIPEG